MVILDVRSTRVFSWGKVLILILELFHILRIRLLKVFVAVKVYIIDVNISISEIMIIKIVVLRNFLFMLEVKFSFFSLFILLFHLFVIKIIVMIVIVVVLLFNNKVLLMRVHEFNEIIIGHELGMLISMEFFFIKSIR